MTFDYLDSKGLCCLLGHTNCVNASLLPNPPVLHSALTCCCIAVLRSPSMRPEPPRVSSLYADAAGAVHFPAGPGPKQAGKQVLTRYARLAGLSAFTSR